MTQPSQSGQPGQSASDAAYASIAHIERRRGQALDIAGLACTLGGFAGLLTVAALLLGWLGVAAVGSALAMAVGLATVLRGEPVPAWLQVRPRGADLDVDATVLDQDDDPGTPYDRARSVEDGAPRSPMSGR